MPVDKLGRECSEETKERMSKAQKGKTRSDEIKRKMRESQVRRRAAAYV